MPLTRQTQVLDGLDSLAGRSMRRAAKGYRKGVVDPLVAAIKNPKSLKGLLRALGPGLVRKMDTSGLETELAGSMVQAGLIGEVTATPKGNVETSKRQNVKTSKRRNVETGERS